MATSRLDCLRFGDSALQTDPFVGGIPVHLESQVARPIGWCNGSADVAGRCKQRLAWAVNILPVLIGRARSPWSSGKAADRATQGLQLLICHLI